MAKTNVKMPRFRHYVNKPLFFFVIYLLVNKIPIKFNVTFGQIMSSQQMVLVEKFSTTNVARWLCHFFKIWPITYKNEIKPKFTKVGWNFSLILVNVHFFKISQNWSQCPQQTKAKTFID